MFNKVSVWKEAHLRNLTKIKFKIKLAEILDWMNSLYQISSGRSYLHSNHKIHRDSQAWSQSHLLRLQISKTKTELKHHLQTDQKDLKSKK